MLDEIGKLLNTISKSSFVDKIITLKISSNAELNCGSFSGMSGHGSTIEINLNFEEIQKTRELYIVKDDTGQKKFIHVNQPPSVTLGHEFGHIIQMLSLNTGNLNMELKTRWSTTIMGSLGKSVVGKVSDVLNGCSANDIVETLGSIDDPAVLSREMLSLSGRTAPSYLQKDLKISADEAEKISSNVKITLGKIYDAYNFVLLNWNGDNYADLFNILPKVGTFDSCEWSDGKLLKDVELLRNGNNSAHMPSYYENKDDDISLQGVREAFTKGATIPVRFGHNPKAIEEFNKFNEETKEYVWTFMMSLLSKFGIKETRLPIISAANNKNCCTIL
jgi:hypothetical protein